MSINKKRQLFSNIYSPRNQPSLSKTMQNRRDKSSLTPPKTQRSHRDHIVSSIPVIQSYRHANKLTLTQVGMKKILKQLQIQAQVRRSLQQRIKGRNLYLKYDINPFTDEFNKTNKAQPQPGKDTNIIEAITKSSSKVLRAKIKQKLQPFESKSELAYANLLKRRMKQQHKISQGKAQPLIWKKQQQAQPQHFQPNYIQQLNDIIKINQYSYFQRLYKKREHNIFQLVYHNETNFLSSREILNQYYFCHDSISTPTQKSGASHKLVLEELSIFSRDMIRNIKNQYINDRIALSEIDLTLQVDKLTFYQLMLVNTGRVSSKVLSNYLQGDEMQRPGRNLDDDDDTSAKQIEYPIMYPDNTKNYVLNYNPVFVTKEDISEYNKIQRSPFEKKQQDLSLKFQQKLKRLIQLQRKLVSNTIKDRQMMHNINTQKDRTILQQIDNNADIRYNLDLKQIERRMRLNKIGKNRSERIKIDIVNETFRMKKKQEVGKSKQRRRSISPNGTIRK